jgi:site-specific DNA-cytosine methylase
LTAGVPCKGFSDAGRRQAYNNPESALFVEVLRNIHATPSIKFLFLENVGAFLRSGMSFLVAEVHRRHGFELRWCVAEARDVGSPQLRRRWFCFGSRAALPFPVPKFSAGGYASYARRWLTEVTHRKICPGGTARSADSSKKARNARVRASLIGNGVVPDCARFAFLHLMSTHGNPKAPGQQLRLGGRVMWPRLKRQAARASTPRATKPARADKYRARPRAVPPTARVPTQKHPRDAAQAEAPQLLGHAPCQSRLSSPDHHTQDEP